MEYKIYFKEGMNEQDSLVFKEKITELFNEDFIKKITNLCNKNIIFSIGGDGTFLSAVSKYGLNYLYIPINEGNLGFYTSWTKNDLTIESFNKVFLNQLPLLNINFDNNSFFCINESTLINPIKTQILDIYINDILFENFRGTGICVCTPSGSTGYNKSLGGALLDHHNELFEITKIAPINNNIYRTISNSIILSKDDVLKIKFKSMTHEDSIITIDKDSYKINSDAIQFSLSNEKLSILSNDISFWNRIKDSFLL